MKKILFCLSLVATAFTASAQVTTLFQGASDLVGLNRLESDGTTYVAASVDGSGIFGSGDALRIADLTATDKPEAVWQTPSGITSAFRLDIRAYTTAIDTGNSQDINLRFADSDDTITSTANVMATISFEASGKLKANGSTGFTFTSGVAADVSLVFNVSGTDTLNYTLFDQTLALAPATLHMFVDGTLVSTKTMAFGANFDPVKGVSKIGFTGSSDSAVGMDYTYDDFMLYQGSDISVPLSAVPEPSSFALIFGMVALGFASRRRRATVA